MRRIRFCKVCDRYMGYYTLLEWKEAGGICSHCCISTSFNAHLWDQVKVVRQVGPLAIVTRDGEDEEKEPGEHDAKYGRCGICRFAGKCYGLNCYKQNSRDALAILQAFIGDGNILLEEGKRYPLETYCE
jgi:hypothetical protein